MPYQAIYCKVANKSTSEISNWVAVCGINSRGLGLIHPREPLSHTNGWLGMPKEDLKLAEKTSLSIWDIVGSIGTAIRKGRARLSVRSYFGGGRVGWIQALGVIWKEWVRESKRLWEKNRNQPTRREVTEELSCRARVCPVCRKE